MSSILDQYENLTRKHTCECGGTILIGCNGTEQEHDYCDRCDWSQDRAEVDTWFTWRTDAAHGGVWAKDAEAALSDLVAQHEWAEIDSARESREISDGAWLTISHDGLPVLTRGEMP